MRLPGRSREDTDPLERIDALARAMDLLGADVAPDVVDRVADDLLRAHERTGLDPSTTVVALVGATGSGKSSLFNALVGSDLAEVGVLRPTTTDALAAVLPGHEAARLLEWIGVDRRVLVPAGAGLPPGVALVDVPDIDSVSAANRGSARRLAERVDLVVWVLDPQKYADDVIHTAWVAPMARQADVTVTALSQVDRLGAAERRAVATDLTGLLRADGVPRPRVLEVSSVTGEGVDGLRELVAATAEGIRTRALRVQGVLDRAVDEVTEAVGLTGDLPDLDTEGLAAAAAGAAGRAAGVERVVDAVGAAHVHRGVRACGWLPVRWLRSLRADPLARLHLGGGAGDSVPTAAPVPVTAAAELSTGVRRVVDRMGEGRPPVWRRDLHAVSRTALEDLPARVDTAVAGTDLGMSRPPRWWGWSSALQWIGWACAVAGVLWVLGVRLAAQFLLVDWAVPVWRGLPVPTWLLLGGIVWTLLVAALSRPALAVGRRTRERRARRALLGSVEEALAERLVAPLVAEDHRQREITGALAAARR